MTVVEHNSPATLAEYKAENLGAPFDVVLIESVREFTNPLTGQSEIQIPNLRGLLQEAAVCRSLHPRRFSGEDITFIRKAVPLKAKTLAGLLDISPEHLSRCESSDRILSSSCEKLLRLITICEAKKTKDALEVIASQKDKKKKIGNTEASLNKILNVLSDIQNVVLSMKISSVYDVDSRLSFSFKLNHKAIAHSCAEFKDLVDRVPEFDETWKLAKATDQARAA